MHGCNNRSLAVSLAQASPFIELTCNSDCCMVFVSLSYGLAPATFSFFFLRCCCCRLVQVDEDKLQRKAGKKKTRNRRDFHVIQQSRFAFSTEIEYQIDTE
jgi:hypothetical protein